MVLLIKYFFLILLVLLILLFLNLFLIEKGINFYSREENSSYECGFEHNSLSRIPFSIRYFLLTIIFLVFDIEVALMTFIPLSLSTSLIRRTIYISLMVFILVLVAGLFYE
jgi:NADH-ubiquinone oxidoreductase chain 3